MGRRAGRERPADRAARRPEPDLAAGWTATTSPPTGVTTASRWSPVTIRHRSRCPGTGDSSSPSWVALPWSPCSPSAAPSGRPRPGRACASMPGSAGITTSSIRANAAGARGADRPALTVVPASTSGRSPGARTKRASRSSSTSGRTAMSSRQSSATVTRSAVAPDPAVVPGSAVMPRSPPRRRPASRPGPPAGARGDRGGASGRRAGRRAARRGRR